ncbi:hypothetical protein KDW_50140 [Dictyobacter vulcani]|uniref:Phenazine biosynthesis protein n=1 Tax=Dictyobacter vulcani TaxID=2607529 RepID=A0A5J4KUH7_9CHLR|nr:PhzF family phenazine biosynthesis protein [Dictyobacter vulcani]GER90852.1 hypothetical protein KDW_50140 [Dictyobacter vulcani]
MQTNEKAALLSRRCLYRPCFRGNPLAVFTDAEGISAELMQILARELNLSESTFVLPAQQIGNDYQVRIFTPAAELPMAGHPTLGTAFVLAHQRFISLKGAETRLTFEEGVGPIAVSLFAQAGQVHTIQMQQPLPTFGPVFADREIIASMLSLKREDLENELPLEAVSCGVPFLFVPIKKLEAMHRIRFRQDLWERELSGFPAPQVLAFTREVEIAGSTVHSRMFAPGLGLVKIQPPALQVVLLVVTWYTMNSSNQLPA